MAPHWASVASVTVKPSDVASVASRLAAPPLVLLSRMSALWPVSALAVDEIAKAVQNASSKATMNLLLIFPLPPAPALPATEDTRKHPARPGSATTRRPRGIGTGRSAGAGER